LVLVDINQLINSSIILITVLINKKSQIHEGFWLFRGSERIRTIVIVLYRTLL